ncbi:MAG: hypothetical protein Q7J08_08350 [Methanocorpusculum sp.]|uniref:hypothetical protein n=1 Tax=Methanocorpusculum sp. TaxID=2058474 RepID=UPI002720C806|nr:hypothetical protein [Methanocorpusculum sp.]MDO9523701.1 hypothetical protein [Methanocorpusculum sp.]
MTDLPEPGELIDLLKLREIRQRDRINVYLYMDEEIAKTSNVMDDVDKYRMVDPDYRPVLEIEDWLKNMQKHMKQIEGPGANVEKMLKEQPLTAEILETGTMQTAVGPRGYIKALLPYLDEMEEMEVREAKGFK